MEKQESLDVLETLYTKISQMSENELFDYMINNSGTFKNDVGNELVNHMMNGLVTFKNDVEDFIEIINIRVSSEIVDNLESLKEQTMGTFKNSKITNMDMTGGNECPLVA